MIGEASKDRLLARRAELVAQIAEIDRALAGHAPEPAVMRRTYSNGRGGPEGVAHKVRCALAKGAPIEPRVLARSLGLDVNAVACTLKREVKMGRAVQPHRGVYQIKPPEAA